MIRDHENICTTEPSETHLTFSYNILIQKVYAKYVNFFAKHDQGDLKDLFNNSNLQNMGVLNNQL